MLARKKPWERLPNLVPKPDTRRQDDKGPERNAAWLGRVRLMPCLVCVYGEQRHPTRAHHPRGLFPRTMGVRISDLLCLPLCDRHHDTHPGSLHKAGDEAAWWKSQGIEPYGVILSQLAQCRDPERDDAIAFVKLHRERNREPQITRTNHG